jgi:hypothetical protein
MRERNQKHGHKRSEHQHGGKSMGKPNKRRRIAKRNRAKKIERMAQLGRLAEERAALAAADPFSDTRPTLPSALFHESTPAAVPMFEPVTEPSPVAASDPQPEPTPQPTSARRDPPAGRGMLALFAFAMVATASVAFVRACEHGTDRIEDDAATVDPCADDAALCVALA